MTGQSLTSLTEAPVSVNLRWRDLDALGHVNYASYLTILEEARDRWLVEHLGISGGHEYVVAHAAIDYRSALELNDGPATVQIGLITMGTTSLKLSEVVHASDGRLAAEADVMIVMWDSIGGRARALTDSERAALTPNSQLHTGTQASHTSDSL
jgi:acyl-CoA thioester hydrolase